MPYQSRGYQGDSYDGLGGDSWDGTQGGDDSFLPGFGGRGGRERGNDRGSDRGSDRGGSWDDERRGGSWDADYDSYPGGDYPTGDRGPGGPGGPGGLGGPGGDQGVGGPGHPHGPGHPRGPADYDYDDYDSRDNLTTVRRKRGPVRRLAPWIALVVILVPLIVAGLYVYHLWDSKYHPADFAGPGTGPAVTLQVTQGATASGLAPQLVQLGVVASSRAFILAAENSKSAATLEPGTYKLNRHMQATLAYAALLNPKNRVQLTVTIKEGQRAAQIIATLATSMHLPVADFEKIIDNPGQLGLPSYAKGKVEGYLFPATYDIQPKETPLQALQAMVAKFNQVSQANNLPAAAHARGLNMEQLMIEASMVQAEGGSDADFPKIARVIINRFNNNMALQFDSVLEYGLNRFAVNIQNSWASIPGPYNDFLNKGLPPTPISNPGLAAIDGVLHPASGDWLYFLAFPGGKSQFSATPLSGQ